MVFMQPRNGVATIDLHGRIFREDGQFVCYCDELDISTQGDTLDETIRRSRDMVAAYFEAARKTGGLQAILARLLPPGASPGKEIDLQTHFDVCEAQRLAV